jgi:hypothetical protein
MGAEAAELLKSAVTRAGSPGGGTLAAVDRQMGRFEELIATQERLRTPHS